MPRSTLFAWIQWTEIGGDLVSMTLLVSPMGKFHLIRLQSLEYNRPMLTRQVYRPWWRHRSSTAVRPTCPEWACMVHQWGTRWLRRTATWVRPLGHLSCFHRATIIPIHTIHLPMLSQLLTLWHHQQCTNNNNHYHIWGQILGLSITIFEMVELFILLTQCLEYLIVSNIANIKRRKFELELCSNWKK